MEDKAKQDELIGYFEKNNYDKAVIEQARDDFEAGLSIGQVSIYKVRRLKEEERSVISKAMRLDMPQELVKDMVNHKYKLPQYVAVVNEFANGTDLSIIEDVMKEFRFGHDINETFSQVKDRLANSMEKPPEPEIRDDEGAGEDSQEEDGAAKEKSGNQPLAEKQVIIQSSIGSKEFMDSVKMMIDTFSNTMKMQFDRMERKDEEYRKAHDNEAEKALNDKISSLERELSDSRKNLSAASGVVNDKEQLIRSMQSDMDNKAKELSIKDEEIKRLRKEMEQMKAGNGSVGGFDQAIPASGADVGTVRDDVSPMRGQTESAGEDIPKGHSNYTGNYTMNLKTANGRQIPIQVERTERKSSLGISAFMSKFLPKGPAKTLLTRMIEGRYSGEQLAEIVYAYDHKLNEAEVKELLDANLPAEEMHGIINVVAAAKGGEE